VLFWSELLSLKRYLSWRVFRRLCLRGTNPVAYLRGFTPTAAQGTYFLPPDLAAAPAAAASSSFFFA
jgi:hypothetical protein